MECPNSGQAWFIVTNVNKPCLTPRSFNNAAKTDTNGLWNSSMGTDLNIAGITRAGNSGAPMLCRRSSMPLRPICSCSHKETINSVPDGP